ncbi:hypothetical protein A6A40_24080 (plasmid) [Azospirillum humicireducens]|uniref:SGNH/GDSL hydrolase family protein n=1 Tax=Azospirillum humicireducens TaxID=1226968 RepID=A0A2R4VUL6_9PROT|nr:hypothetical protein [Azospirillum humicireducens]AWB08114.1 hypothetical protein A6A40_24080 [Azospirillum humicireducens]
MHSWYFVGDSHVQAFEIAATLGLFRRQSHFLIVPGATAVGLRNPESHTQAIAHFQKALLPVLPGVMPVIQLGEVDCGFVIWWRAQTLGESVDAQLAASIEAYACFIDTLIDAGYSRVVVTGAVPPTIPDNHRQGAVARARHTVSASLRERTDLTMRYNRQLAAEAARRRIPYTDISARVLDAGTGLIADAYRSPNPRDHHLHPIQGAHAWAEAINALEV